MKKLLILLLAFSFACQAGKNSKEQNSLNQVQSLDGLKGEVLFIHDEVMPKMGELRRTRKDLLLLADSLMDSDSTQAKMLTALADEIGDASEGMRQWMRDYEPNYEGTEEEVRMYFEAEKEAIQLVKDNMEKSLAKGKEMINQD